MVCTDDHSVQNTPCLPAAVATVLSNEADSVAEAMGSCTFFILYTIVYKPAALMTWLAQWQNGMQRRLHVGRCVS